MRPEPAHSGTWKSWAILGLLLISSWVAWLATANRADPPMASLGAAADALVGSGLVCAVWLGAAMGWGRVVARGLGLGGLAWVESWPLGVAVMLWLAHAIGAMGLLAGASGMIVAWCVMLVGIAVLLAGLKKAGGVRVAAVRAPWHLVAPVLALLAVVCCLPPGTIWSSEAHGYDVLSYHLELPRRWLGIGAVRGLETNVYSWLPSYLEAAYAQVGALLGAGLRGGEIGDGRWIIACQFLHAGMGVAGAIGVGSWVRRLCDRDLLQEDGTARFIAAAAGAVVASVPWVLVCGAEAYSEMGVIVCFAGAMLLCACGGGEGARSSFGRGAAIGLLVGASIGCKLTAAYMVAPSVLIGLLASGDQRRGRQLIGACLGGAAALAPWWLRDWAQCGNPVFPFLPSVFGQAHWTPDQFDRWNSAHHASATISERLGLLLSEDRGLLHEGWLIFGPLVILGTITALLSGVAARRIALLAGMLLLQMVAWLWIGHLQSRFLLPMAVPGAALIAIGLPRRPKQGTFGSGPKLAAGLILLVQQVFCARLVLNQNRGEAFIGLVGGVGMLNGDAAGDSEDLAAMEFHARMDVLLAIGPAGACNRVDDLARLRGEPPMRLLPLGDALGLYYRVDRVSHTTWDRWPLLESARSHPDDPAAWVRDLRAMGVTHVLLNLSELDRLMRSGYSPPEMTPEFGARLAELLGDPVLVWPGPGIALLRVPPP